MDDLIEKQKEARRALYLKFHPREIEYKHKYYQEHKEEISARNKTYYAQRTFTPKLREKQREYSRKQVLIAKTKVFSHYCDGKIRCMCRGCSETNLLFLTIDHLNGGGMAHRKEIGINGGWKFYVWLIKNNFPEGYQVLCFNCNCGKNRNSGLCPHLVPVDKL